MRRVNFPLSYFTDNLIFNKKGKWFAFYEVEDYNYAYLSDADKLNIHKRLQGILLNFPSQVQLLIIPDIIDPEREEQGLRRRLNGSLEKLGNRQFGLYNAYLEDRDLYRYRYFIGICLPKITKVSLDDTSEWLYLYRDLKRYIEYKAGLADLVSSDELQLYRSQEEIMYKQLSEYINARRLLTSDIGWLIRRGFYRGIGDPSIPRDWAPHFDAPEELLMLTEGRFEHCGEGRALSVEQHCKGYFQQGFMMFLLLSHLPDELNYPGNEWLYALGSLPFPVEVCARTWQHEYGTLLSRLVNLSTPPQKRPAGSGKLSFFKTSVNICISAPNEKVLHLRLQMIKDLYAGMNIEVAVPYGEQWTAFNDFVPGSAAGVRDYIQYMSVEAVAVGMFAASRNIGHEHGHFLGMAEVMPVLFDTRRPAVSSESRSALLVGESGSGRSYASNLMVYQALLDGSKVLIFDAKGERSQWLEQFPELAPITMMINLEDESAAGILDPLQGMTDTHERLWGAETAKRILQILAGAPDGTYEATLIGKAVDFVVNQEKEPSMQKILSSISNGILIKIDPKYDSLRSMVELLQDLSTSIQGKLLFADRAEKMLDWSKALIILQAGDLRLGMHQTTIEKQLMLAVSVAAAHFGKRFYHHANSFKVILFEESDFLLEVREGVAMLDELLQLAEDTRSALYLISKTTKKLLNPARFAYKFVFQLKHNRAAASACALLGIDSCKRNIELLQNLQPGICFFSDHRQRVNSFKFMVLDEQLAELFSKRESMTRD